jgi:hypothetical protein
MGAPQTETKFPWVGLLTLSALIFTSVTSGHGRVIPKTRAPQTSIMSKVVVLGPPPEPATVTTALYAI